MLKLLTQFLVLLFIIGCTQQQNENSEKVIPVKIFKVKPESISKYIRATGTILAEDDVIVYSKTAERIEKIFVKPGQYVSKDQIILQQKNDVLRQSLVIANSVLKSAEIQAKLAIQEFERMQKLYEQKAISQQQYDQAKTTKETAELALNQARASYEQAREQYEYCFIKAPFDGIVAAIYVEENQMINIGQPIAQIVSPSKMKSKIYLTGKDIQHVKQGQLVIIKSPTIPNVEFYGRVEKINTALNQTSKSLEVEITILSKDNRLKSGMFGEFLIEVESHPNSIVIPEYALLTRTEIQIDRETGLQIPIRKYFLFTVQKGKAVMNEVKIGIVNNDKIEITEGLKPGDSIIVVGQNIVKENQLVKVIE